MVVLLVATDQDGMIYDANIAGKAIHQAIQKGKQRWERVELAKTEPDKDQSVLRMS